MITGLLAAIVILLVATHPVAQRLWRPRRAAAGPGRTLGLDDGSDLPRAAVIRLERPHRRPLAPDRVFDLDAPAAFPLHVRAVKRGLDLVCSAVGLVLVAPLMIAVAIAVKLSSPGPILFRQERVRRVVGGREVSFMMLKFRSMRQDAEKETGPVWATTKDPRITPVGAFIRKTRLDELPQLFNVVRGEMSLVGPRPERPHFTRQLQDEIPAYEDRSVALKPGITGWAQVSCEYDSTVDDVRRKLLYDLAYAAHLYRLSSYLRMELRILLRTVLVVVTGRGAH